MNKITIEKIKKLREKTGAGVMDCRKALEESGGDIKKAEEWLKKKGIEVASKREDKATNWGLVDAYIHHDGSVGAIISLVCETDFVARTQSFKTLAHEVAMQVTATDPSDINELLAQPWLRDERKTIGDLIRELSGKTGEKIEVKNFKRLDLKQ